MLNNQTLKFKKNESFYIRDGWFEKAINTIDADKEINVFAKNNGTSMLGIGSNMVKGLRYWLQASKLISSTATKTSLIEFGNLVLQWDRYFETDFTWFLVHYFLCTNYIECPVFYGVFSSDLKSFKKQDLITYLHNLYLSDGFDVKNEYIDDDLGVFLKSYLNEEVIQNPEDNYVCPLSNLKLLKKRADKIEKTRPVFSTLSYLIVYYALAELYKFKPFNIEDSFDEPTSPYKIFNLDKNMYLQYLEEMKKNKLIEINKTAGLNVVYFKKKKKLEEVFEDYFGGKD